MPAAQPRAVLRCLRCAEDEDHGIGLATLHRVDGADPVIGPLFDVDIEPFGGTEHRADRTFVLSGRGVNHLSVISDPVGNPEHRFLASAMHEQWNPNTAGSLVGSKARLIL